MTKYPTAHIDATPDDFAKTVLMPGDPLRSKFIAENFLSDVKLVNNVRGIQGYTGYYKGTKVSVMASGMGMPSMAIYSYELFNIFGVENIIRVGSAGAMREDVKVKDIVIAQGASTNSAYAQQFHIPGTLAPISSFALLEKAVKAAKDLGVRYHVGNILSSDAFYAETSYIPKEFDSTKIWSSMGVMAVEMEAAALYINAAAAGKNALAICTISDHLLTGEETTSQERQTSFTDMMKLALEVACMMDKE